MRSRYKGVKYYGPCDWGNGFCVDKAISTIAQFNEHTIIDNVNQVLELYNIKELIQSGEVRIQGNNTLNETCHGIIKQIDRIVGEYFRNICNYTIEDIVQSLGVEYEDDFWHLFSSNKVYDIIDPEFFARCLLLPDVNIFEILRQEKIVKTYDEKLANYLRLSEQLCTILILKYLERKKELLFLPQHL